ncbi:SIR2 family NAD-dependent protein deacylase [Paenibacillus silagei]|uniref:SIR2-like domain-containing protein n=1 Tax=Paenibacillus silagei TaxID=1670801 RepID=A0ABS4NTK5_9BACL|nr:SIR2 family protein [Paenibacillus silagei]MBP2113390.1 hypothetical protein [Paenibacillus silagei]
MTMDELEMKLAVRHIVDGLLRKMKGFNSGGVFFFLGAGFSMRLPGEQLGVGSAKVIAKELAEQVGLEDEDNLLRLSEYIEVVRDKKALIGMVKEHIDNNYCIKESHKMMSEILKVMNEPRELLFSANYDTFIEDYYFSTYNKHIQTWHYNDEFSNDKTLYKIHGCINSESNIVLTSEDFYKVRTHDALMKRLFSIMRENTCVFIGFSLEDQDLLDLLFSIRALNENIGQQKHYIVIPDGGMNKYRLKYLKEKFNIEHIALGRDEILQRVLEDLKKKVMMRE